MANIRMGEVVKVLVDGYSVPAETLGVVSGFNASGVIVNTVRYGMAEQSFAIPSFAIRRHVIPQVEMIWNRLRTKEEMIMRAMRRWGVTSILFEPTDVGGEIFKVSINKSADRWAVRARSISDALKMALTLAYFTKFNIGDIAQERDEMLRGLEALREEVRAL